MEGWIKIHRKIREKGWYKQSGKVHLWIELLLRASRKEREFMFNGENITLKPGQLIAGRKSLAEATGLSESFVERTLTFFEKSEQQIEQQKTNRNRLITILSWHEYQTTGQQSEQPVNNQRTTSEQPVNTYKNIKKEKNVKNKNKYGEFVSLTDDEYQKLVTSHGKYWADQMIKTLDNYKGASGKKYKSDYRAVLSWVEEKVKHTPAYANYMTKKRQEEARSRAQGTKDPLPGTEKIGKKIEPVPTTNKTYDR